MRDQLRRSDILIRSVGDIEMSFLTELVVCRLPSYRSYGADFRFPAITPLTAFPQVLDTLTNPHAVQQFVNRILEIRKSH
jgi:hypothetical protein